jgi:phosphatidylglycerol:prolipoprotein diacylglycerol transferase
MMAMMVIVAATLAYRFGPRFGVPQAFLERITIPFVLMAFIGARLGYVLSHPAEFTNPLEILRIDHGGLSSHGAIVAGFLMLWIFSRRSGISMWNLADTVVWTIPLGNIFVRFGKFMNGELYGDVTTVPWDVQFPGVPGHRHPLQVYEMIFAGLILLIAVRLARRRMFPGQICWAVLVLTSLGRILFDLFRSADRVWGVLTLGQIPAIILVLIGIWFLLTRRQRGTPTTLPSAAPLP